MRALVLALVVAVPVRAQTWAHAGPGDKVALNPAVDYVITGVGFAGFVLPELFKQSLAPADCRACNPSLNGVDAWFHDQLTGAVFSRGTSDTLSNAWAFGAVPLFALGSAWAATGPDASSGAGARAAVIVLESSALSAAAVQSVKFFVARQRPFAHYGHGEASGKYDLSDRDSHLSFPSGHTAFAASLGVSAAMLATLQDSSAAPWLWGAAAAVTVSTGALRMMAEKHYFTDVLGGALIGVASGVAVPLLHRRGSVLSESSMSISPTTVSFAGSF